MRCGHLQSKEENEEGREEWQRKESLAVLAFGPGKASGHREQEISGACGSSEKNKVHKGQTMWLKNPDKFLERTVPASGTWDR